MKKIPAFLGFSLLSSSVFAGEWVTLFDGETLDGWVAQGDVNWSVTDGAITADSGEVSLLTTVEKYLNYELVVEFKAAPNTNSGIMLNSEPVVEDESVDCYEANIAPPTNAYPTGSIVKFIRVGDQGESSDWRNYRLRVDGNLITVHLDGRKLYELSVQIPRPAGHIGLQKNRGPIAFRNIRIMVL